MSSIFEIRLKSLSPISITKRNFGILYETYHFIPSWTMWNAFVKLYAILNPNGGDVNYKDSRNLFEEVRLTNFYIFDNNQIIKDKELENQRKFVSSELKTAISPLTNTSLEGALYEREFLHAKEFIGWVKTGNNYISHFFESQLKNTVFFIGADKNSGFGKIKAIQVKKADNISLDSELNEAIHNPKNNTPFLPVEVSTENIFPLTLREWDEKRGSGMKVRKIGE